MTMIDPFLHIWDEQFHALVAKNMLHGPLEPHLLPEDLLVKDPTYWPSNYTWLHKPPLFLWQMALSMKIFGVNAAAIRLPSAVLSALMIPAMYRTGKLIWNERTGFIAAVLICFSNIHINTVSGVFNTDHNDVVFAAYIFFSCWAFTEYVFHRSFRWCFLTGTFVAAAVLTKWLPGLLILGAWGICLLFTHDWRRDPRRWKELMIAIITTILIAAPWFIRAWIKWPSLWVGVLKSYSQHFSEVLDHPGGPFYHFEQVQFNYGWWMIVLMFVGMISFFRKKSIHPFRIFFATTLLTVFLFYSFVASKMPLFCFIIYPLLLLVAGIALEQCSRWVEGRTRNASKLILPIALLVIGYFELDLGRIEHHHTERDPSEFYRKTRMHNRNILEEVARTFPAHTIVFNCGSWNAVPMMFYTGFQAFDDPPSMEDAEIIMKLKRPIRVLDSDRVPDWIRNEHSDWLVHADMIRNGF
jgi:4-amino-4-deoxy-L-arabinose transferase